MSRAMRSHLGPRLTRDFPIFFAGVVFLSLSYGVLSTHAQVDRSWRTSDGFTNDGNWFNGNNWTPIPTGSPAAATPPTATQSASINNGPMANVRASGAQAKFLIVGGSNADTDNTLPPFRAGSGQVLVNGSTASLQLGQQATNLNTVSLDVVTGSLTVENGGTLGTTNTRVGTFQTPTVGLAAVAQLAPTSPAFIDLTGAGSNWIERGRVDIGADESAQVVIQDGASFTGSGTVTINGLGELDIGGGSLAGTFSAANIVNDHLIDFDFTNAMTLAAQISGTGMIEKLGSGTLILAGNNSYSGGTTISAGTLQLGNGGTTGSILLNVIDNGTLAFDRSDSVTFTGLISGTGAVTQNGTGTVTLTAANAYSGGTNFNAGILAVASDANLGTGVLTFNGGTLEALAGITSGKAVILNTGGGTFLADTGTVSTLSGNISGSGSFTKAGPGELTLTGSGTYGGTAITAGTLRIGAGGTTGSIVGNVADSGTLAFDRSDSVTFGGIISSTGNLVQLGAGTLILTGNSTYSGGTTISPGTLQLGNGGTSGSIAGHVTDDGALVFNRSDSVTFGGAISGTGGLTQVGSGTLILSGTNTYSGNTNVNVGRLLVDGSLGAGSVNVASGATLGGTGTIGGAVTIQNGGILAPGDSPGTLTTGTLTLNSGSLLNYRLGTVNVAGGGVSDLVNVHGNLTLAGMLNVSNAGGFGSGVYRLFNYTGSLTNDGLNLRTLPSGFSPGDFLVQTTQPGEVNLVVSSGGFATQFWDGSNTVADGIIHGGSGTWDTRTTNWTNASATANAPWQNGFAVFEGTAGTVSLGNNIHISGMQFITNGYTIVAPGALTLIGAPETTIRVDQGVSATISAPIVDGTSPAAITKADLGALILTGANTYSGGTLVNAGTLVAAANSALGSGLVTVNDPSLLRIDPGVTVTNFIQLNNGGSLDNAGTVQVTAVAQGPAAAVTTAGGATITNEGGAKISGIGLIAIQSLNGPATITNSGSISGTQGILLRGGGTITNNAGGAIGGLGGPAIATAAPASTAGPAPLPGPVTVVNSGTITGATSGIGLGGGGSVTNTVTGQVTGTGGTAVVIGGSQAKLSNAGQISGDVQLNASSNTAQLFTGGKISGNLALTATRANRVILDGSGTQLFSQSVTGTISNAGSLTKQGTGEWILDKNLSPPVSTLINSGILEVNGGDVLTSPTVTVGPGAELLGLGTIAGSLINNGLVTPGDGPGTLTVTGNYTQGSAGVLNIQLASGSHGLLAVGGQAFLGGTLRLSLVNGFVPVGGQRFTILTAGVAVNGTFSLVQQPTATTFTVFYDPKDVQVGVGQVPFQNFACNPNTRSVLTTLQSVRNTATGDLATVIDVLNGLPTNQLCAAGGQISPLPVPSLPTQVINSLDNASVELDQRLWFLEQPFDSNHRWDIYVDGGGTFGRIKNIFDLPALDFDTGWSTPGADYRFSPSLALGVYAGYAHSESRFSDHTHVSTDTPSAGTYGLWNPPSMGPFGIDAGFGGGYNDYSMKRPIKFGDPIDRQASSNPRSKYFKYRLGTSYHKKLGKLNVEFLGSYEYASIENDQFFEHGAYSLDTRVGKYDVPSLRQRFGIHAVYDIPINSKVTITPDFRFTWIHEYLDGTRTVPVSLNSGLGPGFSLSQPHGPRDEYISVIGFYAVFGELKGYLYWTSDFGSGIVTSNSIMGGVTLNF